MLFRNANAYVGGKFQKVDILVNGERIAKVGRKIPQGNEQVCDAKGLVALPGLIDMHVHFREPGQTHKEDFLSGSMAAVAGGYTLVYDMPNNAPVPTTTKEALDEKRRLSARALCEIRFHFGATNFNVEEVKKAQPESLKMYLDRTTGSLLLDRKESVVAHMQSFPKDKPIFIHAEAEGVRMALEIARNAGRRVHITHVPSVRELDMAKSYSLASMDCTPHHLFLSTDNLGKLNWMGAVKPPLQPKKDVALLWKNLEKIDAVATDHAPHLKQEKVEGAYGFPGVETALALFLDAYSKKKVSLEWIASRFSENPAKIMGLAEYGRIAEGCYANLAFVDLKKSWTVEADGLHTKAKWSPFEGMKLKGRVVKTVCRGKVAFQLS